MKAIATLRFAQSREIDLQIFFMGARSSLLSWFPDHKPSYSYLIVHSDQVIKLRKACAVPLCISAAFRPMKATPGKTHFSPVMFIKEWVLCKIMCHSVTKGRRFNSRSCDLHFYVPDLNRGHDWLSAKFFFLPIPLWPLNNTEKKLVHSLFYIMLETVQ